jgi:hypothetical protein
MVFQVAAAMGNSPFAVLTAVVAPAMLTNASAVLSLATSNRLARVVDRHRAVVPQAAKLDRTHPDHAAWTAQLDRLEHRGQLLVRALRSIYLALGLFAAATLLAVFGGLGAFYGHHAAYDVIAMIALGAGGLAVTQLVASCVYMVRETQLAVQNLAAEAQLTRSGAR